MNAKSNLADVINFPIRPEMKTCNTCGVDKAHSEFYTKGKQRNGNANISIGLLEQKKKIRGLVEYLSKSQYNTGGYLGN